MNFNMFISNIHVLFLFVEIESREIEREYERWREKKGEVLTLWAYLAHFYSLFPLHASAHVATLGPHDGLTFPALTGFVWRLPMVHAIILERSPLVHQHQIQWTQLRQQLLTPLPLG